ncbi:putative polyketide synthase [Xylariaceae sp. FL1019]|nr:putative polyketide synthase [Xylariaceae sp. FL1019]
MISTDDHCRIQSGHESPPLAKPSRASGDTCSKGDIAVLGFSFEFPQASSEESLWSLIVNGESTARTFPPDRLSSTRYHDPNRTRPGTICTDRASFLERDIGVFDAKFFGMTAEEASGADPQQRILLETTYHAFENAGIPVESIRGSNTSVHTGYFTADYFTASAKDPSLAPKYAVAGMAGSMLSNKISSFFDITGPSVTVDTACSSSLVALDLACQSIRQGNSTIGIVAGCNLLMSPDLFITLSSLGFLSPDGACHSFDSRANGYGRGEGIGVLIVKDLEEAVTDGNTIRAIIRATGTNQNGRTNLAQPSKEHQMQLIEATYRKAGLDMATTRFFEAHGTGTAIGDPIEAMAIGNAFAPNRDPDDPLFVGSIKANIGHLEGAAGIAGIIKAILVLERGIIPPIANLHKLNENIDASFLNLQFPTTPTPWPRTGLRRASVNSFGFGGTNSHAILDDAYSYLNTRNIDAKHCTKISASVALNGVSDRVHILPQSDQPRLLVWSAHQRESTIQTIETYRRYFDTELQNSETANEDFDALIRTLASRRSLHAWRTFSISRSSSDLGEALAKVPAPIEAKAGRKAAFVFTGQGAQWTGMGKDLFHFECFRESIDGCDRVLAGLGCPWKALDLLTRHTDNEDINEPRYSQPLCTVLQIGLVDLLTEMGVRPSAVIGHSSGEIAAAYASGAISRQSAVKLAYFRGLLSSAMAEMPVESARGGMIAVGSSATIVRQNIQETLSEAGDGVLVIACINSPTSTTVSGDRALITRLEHKLQHKDIFCRALKIPVAYHSPHMMTIENAYCESIGVIDPGLAMRHHATMISTVTGKRVSASELQDPRYWTQNLISTVRFSDAIQRLNRRNCGKIVKKLDLSHRNTVQVTDIIEIGPHSTLQGPIRDTLETADLSFKKPTYRAALVRGQSAINTFLELLGYLYCAGFQVEIAKANGIKEKDQKGDAMTLTTLPRYPFNHAKRYWDEPRVSKRMRLASEPHNEFIGLSVSDWNPHEPRWRNRLCTSSMPWLEDHMIGEKIVFPAAGMIVMAMEAIAQIHSDQTINSFEIRDLRINSNLVIPRDDTGIEVEISLKPNTDVTSKQASWTSFSLYEAGDNFTEICRGSIKPEFAHNISSQSDQSRSRQATWVRDLMRSMTSTPKSEYSNEELYGIFRANGYTYGASFQNVQSAKKGRSGQALGLVSQSPTANSTSRVPIHPCLLDSVFQLVVLAGHLDRNGPPATWVPTYVRSLWVSSSGFQEKSEGSSSQVLACVESRSARLSANSLRVLDGDGNHLIMIGEGLETALVTDALQVNDDKQQQTIRKLGYEMIYKPDLLSMSSHATAQFLKEQAAIHTRDTAPSYGILKIFIIVSMAKMMQKVSMSMITHHRPHLQSQLTWIASQISSARKSLPYGLPPDWLSLTEDGQYDDLCSHAELSGSIGRFYVSFYRSIIKEIDENSRFPEIAAGGRAPQDFQQALLDEVPLMNALYAFIDSSAHKSSAIRVLQIGDAGGLVTNCAMAALTMQTSTGVFCRFSRYDCTDVCVYSSERMSKLLDISSKIQFRALDTGENPVDQGFEENSYDLILMTSNFYTDVNMDTALKNIRRLIRDDGKLIMLDITNPHSFFGRAVVGYFPEWWQGLQIPQENNKGFPVTGAYHTQTLRKSGFTDPDIMLHDSQNEEYQIMSLIISSPASSSRTPLPSPVSPRRAALIVNGLYESSNTPLSDKLETQLRNLGHSDVRVISLRQAAYEPNLANMLLHVIHSRDWLPLAELGQEEYDLLHDMLMKCRYVFWISSEGVTNDLSPPDGGILGLARTLRMEYHDYVFVTLRTDERRSQSIPTILRSALTVFLHGVESQAYEPELVQAGGALQVPRVYESDGLNQDIYKLSSTSIFRRQRLGENNVKLKIGQLGLLDTLRWEAAEVVQDALGAGEIEIEVKAVGVNFKDCLTALGRVAEDSIGSECAGIVVSAGHGCRLIPGDRVLVSALDTFTGRYRCPEQLAAKIPDGMTFAEAGGVATNFVTAYHSLSVVARLQEGESVLIHSGAGGTGQAAIQIAQSLGAEVFTTVGSGQKKQLLSSLYNIPPERILNSRDLSFRDDIMRLTNGRGVDVVLNSLSGDALVASWECVAAYGRFVEIGKKDIFSHNRLPMYQFAKNVSFSAVDIAAMTKERPVLVSNALSFVVDMFKQKRLRMISPLKVFSACETEAAFRYLQSGANAGKVVVEINPDDEIDVSVNTVLSWRLRADCTYVIAGGFGGQGRSVAKWMVSKGVRHIVLLSRSGSQGEKHMDFVRELQTSGSEVYCPPCDIANPEDLQRALDYCRAHMPAIKGCIQAAMVIQDSMFDNMSYESWNNCLKPKIHGSWNLHQQLPDDLDFFVMFSSTAGIIGSQGQSNYAAGNTFKDELARYRTARGQTAISLNLSFLENEGYMAENREMLMRYANVKHMLLMSQNEVLALLEHYCNPSISRNVDPAHFQLVLGLTLPADVSNRGMELSSWMHEPMFTNLLQMDPTDANSSVEQAAGFQNTGPSLIAQVSAAPSVQEAGTILAKGLAAKLISILSLGSDQYSPDLPLHTYGVDSLIAVELRNWFVKVLKVDMAIFEILGGATANSLGRAAAEKMRSQAAR